MPVDSKTVYARVSDFQKLIILLHWLGDQVSNYVTNDPRQYFNYIQAGSDKRIIEVRDSMKA